MCNLVNSIHIRLAALSSSALVSFPDPQYTSSFLTEGLETKLVLPLPDVGTLFLMGTNAFHLVKV